MDYKNARLVLIRLCLPPVALALAACASITSGPTIETCEPGCKLSITLPADITLPPSIPKEQETLALLGESQLEIEVIGAPESQVVLLFRGREAFQSSAGKGRHVRNLSVVLAKSGAKIPVRSWEDGKCRGHIFSFRCKYEIHDVSNPDRPPLDPWIIIRK